MTATTTNTEATIGTLTREDVQALRKADRICLQRFADGAGDVRGIKEMKKRGPYDPAETTYTIKCSHTVSGHGIPYGAPGIQCFEMFGNYTDSVWGTVANILKAGDVISVRWSADGYRNGYVERSRITESSEEMGNAGLGMPIHADAVYLEVRRGKAKMVFLLDVSICPDNTARMVRV